MLRLRMFRNPRTKWERILTKPLKKQTVFLNKICEVNSEDELIITEAFFDNLSFPLVKQIFKLVENVIETGGMDFSFQQIIFDRLLGICDIADLYPEDNEAENNIIAGEGYHVYTASYDDLNLMIEFINSHDDIHSICDLGSGSGRALLYMALQANRELKCLGLELVSDRVEFTNTIVHNFDLKNISFKTCDFLENPEDFLGFDAYYLYDPVGTDDVSLLISYFEKMIADGAKFYILFISGWDALMLDALDNLQNLEKITSVDSNKQEDRYVNFYKVN